MSIFQRIRNFFWWFKIVLTFGDVIETPLSADCADDTQDELRKENDEICVKSVRYNGKISSIQLFVAMVSLGVTLDLWRILSRIDPGGVVNMSVFIVYMLLGLAILIYFNRCKARIVVTEERTVRTSSRLSKSERDNLLLIGITVFYFLCCVLDVFHIISATCNGAMLECPVGHYTLANGIHIAFHVMRILFFGAQTLFCMAFHRSKLVTKSSTWCGLMCLAAINICLWFDTLTDRIVHFIQLEAKPENIWKTCFLNESDVSEEAARCLAQNTSMHHLIDRYASPLFPPFTFQMVLLLGDCFNRITYHFEKTSRASRRFDYPAEPGRRADDDEWSENNQVSESHQTNDTVSQFTLTQSDDSSPLLKSVNGIQMLGGQAWFLFIFVANVLLMALTVVVRIYTVTSSFVIYTFLFYTFMLLTVFFGYHVSGDFKVLTGVPFSVMDYLLVFTSFGQFSNNLLSFMAQAVHSKNAFVLIQRLTKIAETYLQASFTLYAARVVPRNGDRTFKPVAFRHTLLMLAVCNGTQWIITMGSGLNLKPGPNSRGELLNYVEETLCYGDITWTIVYSSLAPLQIMFRFVCCLMFTRNFLRLRNFVPSNRP